MGSTVPSVGAENYHSVNPRVCFAIWLFVINIILHHQQPRIRVPNMNNAEILHIAVLDGNNAEISRLVSSGTDVDAYTVPEERGYRIHSQHPLQVALAHGHASTILLLLDLGADPRKPTIDHLRDRHGRYLGQQDDHTCCFINLFYRKLSNKYHTGRFVFNHKQHLDILKKLKERGFSRHGANFSEALGHTDFHSGRGGEKLLEFFLEEGANPDTTYTYQYNDNRYGSPRGNGTAPMLQKYLNHTSILKLLRSYGADVSLLLRLGSLREFVDGFNGSNSYVMDHDRTQKEFRVHDPEATIKALTDPVERKFPRSSSRTSDDPRVPGLRAKIERLESQLLACGQSLETCESEKESMRSELSILEDEIGNISARLTRARGESREKDRAIDGLNRAKTSMKQTIRDLRVAVDDGLLTTNRLKAEIETERRDSYSEGGCPFIRRGGREASSTREGKVQTSTSTRARPRTFKWFPM